MAQILSEPRRRAPAVGDYAPPRPLGYDGVCLMDAPELIRLINERHGIRLTLTGRYREGEQGAIRIRDDGGSALVLKFGGGAEFRHRSATTARITKRLRSLGYSAPTYRIVGGIRGVAFTIQEALPGRPMRHLRAAYLPDLFRLNAIQTGHGLRRDDNFRTRIIQSVLVGLSEYCVIDSLREYSGATAELLRTLQAIVRRNVGAIPDARDIVHFDFTPMNILVHRGRISGVVDWEGARTGDCAFDLVTLLAYSYSSSARVREHLWSRVLDQSDRATVQIYLAHLIVRQLDWSIRHHDPQTVERHLRGAQAILADMTPRLA
jgi:Phosphotransferase enzyme family